MGNCRQVLHWNGPFLSFCLATAMFAKWTFAMFHYCQQFKLTSTYLPCKLCAQDVLTFIYHFIFPYFSTAGSTTGTKPIHSRCVKETGQWWLPDHWWWWKTHPIDMTCSWLKKCWSLPSFHVHNIWLLLCLWPKIKHVNFVFSLKQCCLHFCCIIFNTVRQSRVWLSPKHCSTFFAGTVQ